MKKDKREEIKKIFEDKFFLVLDKPFECLSVKASTSKLFSLEEWMREEYPNVFRKSGKQESDFLKRGGVVHRLDKNTTGLVLTAKDEISFLRLQGQFKERKVKKSYYGLVLGEIPLEGGIEVPIARCKQSFGTWEADPGGAEAKTDFLRLKVYEFEGRKYSLVELKPKTGRTHQIRVHLKYMGWPIVGDKIYGGQDFPGLKRLFLHAGKIELNHPETGEKVSFKSKLTDDLVRVLARLGEKDQII